MGVFFVFFRGNLMENPLVYDNLETRGGILIKNCSDLPFTTFFGPLLSSKMIPSALRIGHSRDVPKILV